MTPDWIVNFEEIIKEVKEENNNESRRNKKVCRKKGIANS